MSTPANTSWMPASGRHKVSIGTSLRRALKARGGASVTPKRNNLPDRDFYSFRYNFKPSSVDSTKPGSIDVKKGQENTSVMVEFAGSQPGEQHIFVGAEQQAKDVDCVLIYDEETGIFTLEKLDSYMNLTHERKISSNHTRSSLPPAPSTSTQPPRDLEFEAQLERDLLGTDDDADGEPDREAYIASLRQEDEEEEEREEVQVVAPPPRRSSPKAKTARQAKVPVKSHTPQSIQPAKYKTPARSKSKGKGKVPTLEVEAEDLEFGQPARQAKSIQLSPTSPALALPGSSAAGRLASTPSVPPLHKPEEPQPVTDSENEWEEVQPSPSGQVAAVDTADVSDSMIGDDGEDEEEIDMSAFEEEMNQELNGTEHISAKPISLNQFAGGVAEASQDEDDYTTSDDSDDD